MNTEKNKKTDEVLSSLDGIKKAQAPDFFYTRLMAKMVTRDEVGQSTLPGDSKGIWMLRPVYAAFVLALILIINSFVFLNNPGDESNSNMSGENETLQQSIAAEYSLADNNSIYDLNADK
ncbi:MAG TPA: hypothetical protein VN451_01635 [Chitinophagaceae bacterium]|nr:hypothetical protein [Chitinophagaceae bacterium]